MRTGDWTQYEWDVEEVLFAYEDGEESNDVIEHWFQKSFADCLKHIKTKVPGERCRWDICIVMDDQDARSWAYVDMHTMQLPTHFEDASGGRTRKVPKRFHSEISKGSP